MSNSILISFDIEEFDTPLLHGIHISLEEQMRITREGLENIRTLLQAQGNPPCTFYATANFAQHFPETVKELSQHHEIASHTFYHTTFSPEDIQNSKWALEQLTGRVVQGIRMPNMRGVDLALVQQAGYKYDSSLNPIFLPGKYSNFSKPLLPYVEKGVVEVPASAVPGLRIPLFWLAFKNLPLSAYVALCKYTLRRSGFLNLYFHPWEFADIASYKIPFYVKKPCGKTLTNKFGRLLSELRKIKNAHFSTTTDFVSAL